MYSSGGLVGRRRARSTPPTAARSWTSTRHPADLRDRLRRRARRVPVLQLLGTERRHSRRASGSPTRRRRSIDGTRRRCCSSTCRTSTTTCSGSGRTTRASAKTSRAIDAICGELIAHCRERGRRVIVLSEYGLVRRRPARCTSTACCARRACSRSATSSAPTRSIAGASEAFAVADHQVAHVYVRESARASPRSQALLRAVPGVDHVLDRSEQARATASITSASGELVAIAARDRWFTYYYWLDDRARAGLRAHGRHPPQARLRPGRAVPRSDAARCPSCRSRRRWRRRRSASAT